MSTVSISQHEIEEFQREGVICLRQAFSRDWLESLAAGVTKNFENPGPYSTQYTPASPEASTMITVTGRLLTSIVIL